MFLGIKNMRKEFQLGSMKRKKICRYEWGGGEGGGTLLIIGNNED